MYQIVYTFLTLHTQSLSLSHIYIYIYIYIYAHTYMQNPWKLQGIHINSSNLNITFLDKSLSISIKKLITNLHNKNKRNITYTKYLE